MEKFLEFVTDNADKILVGCTLVATACVVLNTVNKCRAAKKATVIDASNMGIGDKTGTQYTDWKRTESYKF